MRMDRPDPLWRTERNSSPSTPRNQVFQKNLVSLRNLRISAVLKRWDFLLLGLGAWLYLSRVIAERSPLVWPFLALLIVVAGALGVILAALGRRQGLNLTPAALFYLYVLWPHPDPSLAWAVGFVGIVAIAIANLERRSNFGRSQLRGGGRSLTLPSAQESADSSANCDVLDFPLEPIVFSLSFALYLHTLASTVLPADSGEFQLVSYLLGIAHPPGYPLYTMLGKLSTFVSVGDAAHRVNLMSALFAALTLALVCRTVRTAMSSRWGGAVAVIALGAAPTFWAQATTANIRSLAALLTSLLLFALVYYARTKKSVYLILFGLAFGLGVTHHGSLAFLALPFLAFLLTTSPSLLTDVRLLLKPLRAFLLSLCVLLYLPLRSWMGTPFGPADLASPSDFLEHVLARGFRGDMFYFARPDVLPDRLAVLANILDIQFGLPLLLLALLGGLAVLRRRPSLLLLVGGAFAVSAFVAITYRAPQTVEYLMPSYVTLAIAIGCGASLVGRIRDRSLRAVVVAVLLLLAGLNVRRSYPSFLSLSRDRSARLYAEHILQNVPRDAVILSNWHWATPLWYLQRCEGMRPDVGVEYVYPEGAAPMPEVWLRRIRENLERRPVVVTNLYPEFEAASYRFSPLGEAFLVRDEPLFAAPKDMVELDATFGNKIRLFGYRFSSEHPLTFELYWQPLEKLERDYSFFVHLVDGEGMVWGQMDVTHPAARGYEVGEVLADRYQISPLPTAPPGRYRLIAGVYVTFHDGSWKRFTTEEGKGTVTLREVKVAASSVPPVTLHPLHRPFANGVTLVGVDYDDSLEGRRVYLHWHCPSFATDGCDVLLYANGQVADRHRLPRFSGGYLTTAHDLPTGVASLELELYLTDGAVIPQLGPWHWPMVSRLALPTPSQRGRYVNLGGEMVLTGAEWHEPIRAGDVMALDLRFLALRPIVHDYTVSVRLADVKGRWRVQDDSTPALGAIPTLKWIRGTSVVDRHFLAVPPDATSGEAELSLIVYDAFTLRPLAILDQRLAKLGPSVPLGKAGVE